MAFDPAQLPTSLHGIQDALVVLTCRPSERDGWRPPGYPGAAYEPVRPGAPPFDGVYRGSWLSPGICVRLDLAHPAIPPDLADALRDGHPAQIGDDGALYEFGIASSSQHENRDAALVALADKVTAATRRR